MKAYFLKSATKFSMNLSEYILNLSIIYLIINILCV